MASIDHENTNARTARKRNVFVG